MKKIYTLSLMLMLSITSFGQAFTATYDFAGVVGTSGGTTDPTPVPTAAGMVFGSFTAFNPTATLPYNPTAGGRFAFVSMPLGATNGADTGFTGAIDPTIYYQVAVTPNAGTNYSLTGISFGMRRSSTGSRNYAVRSSADNYAANLLATITPANTNLAIQPTNNFFWTLDTTSNSADQAGSTITVSGSAFTSITTAVTFRIYSWNAEASTGSFSIDDVVIRGTVNSLSTKNNEISGLKIYPNPVKDGLLYIDTQANADKNVMVFDILGKQVINISTTSNTVNVSNLKDGVYFVKITEAGKTATRKLVINN